MSFEDSNSMIALYHKHFFELPFYLFASLCALAAKSISWKLYLEAIISLFSKLHLHGSTWNDGK